MSFFNRLFKSDKKVSIEPKSTDTGYYYVCQCRLNTFENITPSNTEFFNADKYKAVIDLGHKFIDENGLLKFSDFFQGDQYFVELWTAHIIFDYDGASEKLKAQCVSIITKYSNNSLRPLVSLQEEEWLSKNIS